MHREELERLFIKYLQRKPRESEVTAHVKKNYKDFELEIEQCEERKGLQKRSSANAKKRSIAILLSGHLRKKSIFDSLKRIIKEYNYNIDVFIHTWDNYGVKGNETKLDDKVEYDSILKDIETIPYLIKYKIENNKNFILNLPSTNVTYFNYSSPEIYIKSQLYSINQCYKLMEEYCLSNNKTYDIVLRSRFDLEINEFRPDDTIFEDVKHKIIFCPNKDNKHSHPDYGTSCQTCDTMYYTHGFKRVHIFEHTTIPCDTFAYGSMESMKKYCDLYNNYDKLVEDYQEINLQSFSHGDMDCKIENNVYKIKHSNINHLKSIYYLNCSYPEKLLKLFLKDYMLVQSKHIKVKMK